MKEKNARPRIARKHYRVNVPLHALKTSEAVEILSNSPRRLVELWDLFEDTDRTIRQRAAAALAQLASLRPASLLRSEHRIRERLQDESAYVRWHAVYAVGRIVDGNRARLKRWISDLAAALEDRNSIVRAMAARVMARVAAYDAQTLCEAFRGMGREVPSIVTEILKKGNEKTPNQELNTREERSA